MTEVQTTYAEQLARVRKASERDASQFGTRLHAVVSREALSAVLEHYDRLHDFLKTVLASGLLSAAVPIRDEAERLLAQSEGR